MTQPHTLYVFGTGNATMTRYYNTCFAIRSGEEYFMTDAGGGNGIPADSGRNAGSIKPHPPSPS